MNEEARILYGPPYNSTSTASLGVHYVECLTKYGDQVAQVQTVDGRVESRTYLDLLHQGQRMAEFLRERGLRSGDTVMVLTGNNLTFTPIMLGTLFIGAAISPILPHCDSSEMLHLLEVIRPQLVICNVMGQSAMSIALAKFKGDICMVSLETVALIIDGDEVVDFQMEHVDNPSNHVALVLTTSGTSGKTKAMEISHSAVLHQADYPMYSSSDESGLERKVVMSVSNPNWGTAHICIMVTLSQGMKLVLMDVFTEEDFLVAVEEFKVNYVMLKPANVVSLAKWEHTEQYDTSSIRSITYGGSALPRAVVELAEARIKTKILSIYGMTETFGILVLPHGVADKSTSLGTLFKGVEAKVVEPETGRLLGPHCEGELCLRTPALLKQYRNNPEATRDCMDQDGFYHSGDIARYDREGYFYYVDRLKELIKYKNEKQFSGSDIEEILIAHENILEVAVVGIDQGDGTEHATAFVVRRPNSNVSAKDLVALVEGILPWYKWLPGGVHFLDSLPKTTSGKILRRVLKTMEIKTAN